MKDVSVSISQWLSSIQRTPARSSNQNNKSCQFTILDSRNDFDSIFQLNRERNTDDCGRSPILLRFPYDFMGNSLTGFDVLTLCNHTQTFFLMIWFCAWYSDNQVLTSLWLLAVSSHHVANTTNHRSLRESQHSYWNSQPKTKQKTKLE